ncbi:MAG: DUF6142 family protein [Butyrivibrio sp.]|nr:DUF6142 family protein [Butyrivibrio sp.]
MAKHRYKFSDKKHSVGGAISTMLALAAVIFFVISVRFSFAARGEGGDNVGSAALASTAFAVFGLVVGLMSYKESNRYRTFSFIGSLSSGIMTIIMVMLFLVGI